MSATALAGAVELLDRSLAYTRGALTDVRTEQLPRRTPCRDWPLTLLLAHLDDSLTAYTEAATGRLALTPTVDRSQVESIRDKACALLGWWLDHPPEEVGIGDATMASPTLVAAAALEIGVHGWDVHATLGHAFPVPADLAVPLLAVARVVVGEEDRHGCFGVSLPPGPGATPSEQLLAFAGRGGLDQWSRSGPFRPAPG